MTTGLTLKQRALIGVLGFFNMFLIPISNRVGMAYQALLVLRMRHILIKPRPGDIYVASAPKTGTTWMQQIVYQVLTGGRGEFEHIYQVAPDLDGLAFKMFAKEVMDAMPSPRIMKTHLYYGMVAPPPDSRVIYVTRNAADAMVSLHHHVGLVNGFWKPLDAGFIRHSSMVNHWLTHLESWWPHRADPNVLHIRYEDMSADLEGNIRKVARFLGVTLEEDRMGDILEKCSFAYMKKHHERFDARTRLFHSGAATKMGFIRKGVVGDSRTALTPEVQTALGERMGRIRKKLGMGETEV
ncbi:sulfotransferase domain-containing protein [Pyxidicoccus sp. MSG2]|uniref:sulfotransferase domain-containing protein n=1 Tax=Pyxidicoccus sp. MSG2 TaxID=2996790 RepID=UPI00226EFA27|nr:sulfotransferase domain-containing protein [Pyxidicoccus sp. MSG2]MCY1022993.1 sulfotransferase domain-containing protein [Pyxidicoccus sp. MSG2]